MKHPMQFGTDAPVRNQYQDSKNPEHNIDAQQLYAIQENLKNDGKIVFGWRVAAFGDTGEISLNDCIPGPNGTTNEHEVTAAMSHTPGSHGVNVGSPAAIQIKIVGAKEAIPNLDSPDGWEFAGDYA